MKKHITVDNYLDTLDDEQIVTVYDDKHNIHYHGKAGNAPLNCSHFEFRNALERPYLNGGNGIEIVINGSIR